jgi:hypothetical protein
MSIEAVLATLGSDTGIRLVVWGSLASCAAGAILGRGTLRRYAVNVLAVASVILAASVIPNCGGDTEPDRVFSEPSPPYAI